MLARTPWTPKPEAKADKKRLSKDRCRQIVETVAMILRTREPTPFAGEGPCRHAIRSALCLQGWSWRAADATAADIVTAALNRIGAKRPTWKEGQPEYTQEGHSPIERTRCIRCHGKLPEGNFKYCSALCKGAHHHHLCALKEAEDEAVFGFVVQRSTRWRAG